MTTFVTYEACNSSLLDAARWLLETATQINGGKAFLPWEAADYEIRNTEYQYQNYEDLDVRLDIPIPPKVGVKLTSHHYSIQIEDVFHYSVVDLSEPIFSDYNDDDGYYYFERVGFNNEFVYALAKALRRFASIVAPNGEPVLLQIKDWHDTALEREVLNSYTPIHQHRPRYH